MTSQGRGILRQIAHRLRHTYRQVRRPRVIRHRNVLLPIDHASYSEEMINVLYANEYEHEETWIVASLLNEDDKVLEMGTGIGYISTLCCKIIKNGQRVHTFEAKTS